MIDFIMIRSMAGLMGVTAFLSMWINNSAAASIMLPVALAITNELESHSKNYHEKKNAVKESTAAVNRK
jgi:di/tricarboxylate transporter